MQTLPIPLLMQIQRVHMNSKEGRTTGSRAPDVPREILTLENAVSFPMIADRSAGQKPGTTLSRKPIKRPLMKAREGQNGFLKADRSIFSPIQVSNTLQFACHGHFGVFEFI